MFKCAGILLGLILQAVNLVAMADNQDGIEDFQVTVNAGTIQLAEAKHEGKNDAISIWYVHPAKITMNSKIICNEKTNNIEVKFTDMANRGSDSTVQIRKPYPILVRDLSKAFEACGGEEKYSGKVIVGSIELPITAQLINDKAGVVSSPAAQIYKVKNTQ